MVLARAANVFSSGTAEIADPEIASNVETSAQLPVDKKRTLRQEMDDSVDLEAKRPPYIHAMLAGGLGGVTGDMMMHSLDTVKTRQQGDPHMPPKYTSLGSTYRTIFQQEGVRRGLYGGVKPAFVGSLMGTGVFFGTYEWSKRRMIDYGVNPTVAYFTAGIVADLAAAPIYVPTEVVKTRLQLQGHHNNPFFNSGYNYRSTLDAVRTIIRTEGVSTLYYGFQHTLWRDLPFSALQFAIYEKEQKLARQWVGSGDIGLPLEILTGASAGGMAGVITCPLDVVKTRVQTQHSDPSLFLSKMKGGSTKPAESHSSVGTTAQPANSQHKAPIVSTSNKTPTLKRPISTSSPSTSLRSHTAATIDTSSVLTGLKIIYKTEGLAGLFRGVGPRFVWTSVQSGTMLVLYQTLLRRFELHSLGRSDDSE